MQIRIYNYQDGVRKLGPGIRFVLWTQGCQRRCKGCMTPMSRDMNGGKPFETSELSEMIIKSNREGITISGGEPFLQAKELCDLIDKVREHADVGVIIYTGYTFEELKEYNEEYRLKLLEKTDLLIDGPYIDELNDGKKLRGSSNQRALLLTERYRDHVNDYGSGKAEVEFFVKEDKVVMVGVPDKDVFDRFRNVYEEENNE